MPDRQARKDVVDGMRRRFGPAPGGAGGADAAAPAGIGDDEIVAAVGAAGTGKSVGEDAAIEVAAEFAFGERRSRPTLPVIVQRQPGGEVRLDETIEERALGAPAAIDGRRRHPDRGIGMNNRM